MINFIFIGYFLKKKIGPKGRNFSDPENSKSEDFFWSIPKNENFLPFQHPTKNRTFSENVENFECSGAPRPQFDLWGTHSYGQAGAWMQSTNVE